MSDPDGNAEWEPLLRFDTDDLQFARGVAVGILWQRLDQEPGFTTILMEENAEMLMRVAEAKDLPFSAEPLADGWLSVTIGYPAEVES